MIEKIPGGWKDQLSFHTLLKQREVDGPIAHVGSLINKPDVSIAAVQKFRSGWPFQNKTFTGIDLFPGPNVDLVADLTAADLFVRHPQLDGAFGFVYCRALLEHVKDPFQVARSIERLLRPGGHLYVGGPWVWGYHPYPDDYWRISFSGLKVLFPGVQFDDWWYSGTTPNSIVRVDDIKYERKVFVKKGIDGIVSDQALPYLNVEAIGKRV